MSLLAVDIGSVEAAEGVRVKSLEQLCVALRYAEQVEVDRDDFHRLFVLAVRVLELDQDTTARIVKASRPTVSRWISGRAAPHRVGRASVFRELRKVAVDKLKQHAL